MGRIGKAGLVMIKINCSYKIILKKLKMFIENDKTKSKNTLHIFSIVLTRKQYPVSARLNYCRAWDGQG